MGLFGGAAKTTTEVKPSPQVEKLLKNIVQETNDIPEAQFIYHELANLSQEQQGVLANVAGSGDLRQAANILSPALTQGMNQVTENNAQYQSLANNPITVNEVLDSSKAIQNGLMRTATNQGLATNPAINNNSAAARTATRRNARAIRANQAINPQATNTAIGMAQNNRSNQLNTTNQLNSLANRNIDLGMQGVGLQDAATKNQLNVGNLQQQLAQAQNDNTYQNANAAAMFPWQSINNKLNVMNEVSGMAGYKTEGVGGGISKAQQIAGAGITGLGIAGNLGAFNSSAYNLQSKLNSGEQNWAGLTQGKSVTGNVGGIPLYTSGNQSQGLMSRIGSYFG